MCKRIVVIGGSASGIYFSLLLKRKRPEYDILLLEKEAKIGKKLLATGNGHCNCLNANLDKECFNNSSWIEKYIKKYPVSKLNEFLTSLGILVHFNEEGLGYPVSNSAASFVNILCSNLKKEGIRVLINAKFLDYDKDGIIYEHEGKTIKTSYDYLVFAAGGKSGKNLGSDGYCLDLVKRKGIDVKPLLPVLCPIKTFEQAPELDGCRLKANVRAFIDNKPVFCEDGEVLFKKDGLSGMVIFNLSRILVRENKRAEIFIYPKFLEEKIDGFSGTSSIDKVTNYESLFEPKIAGFLSKITAKPTYLHEKSLFNNHNCSFKFTYKSNYDFIDSHVSSGGVEISEMEDDLKLKKDHSVILLGEIIDIDGKCGGYNLSWTLISAMAAVENL